MAIGTSNGRLRIIDARNAASASTLVPATGELIHLSSDGQVAFVRRPLRAIALPSGEALHTWTNDLGFYSTGFSADGERIARRECGIRRTAFESSSASCTLEVTSRSGALLFQTPRLTMGGMLMFSPSGLRVAVAAIPGYFVPTLIFEDGQQVASYNGSIVGWLDDARAFGFDGSDRNVHGARSIWQRVVDAPARRLS